MNPNEHLTERSFSVSLLRVATGSTLTIAYTAVSTAQALRKAQHEFPGWEATIA